MESSGFFNAEVQSDGSYDRVYVAEQFAKYFSMFIGNGVFITPATQLKVVPKVGEMSVGISVGDAYINGYWYQNNSLMYKTLKNANGTQDRIDRVVIRWDSSTRTIYAYILEGTPAAIPEAPQITRSADIYELALADVYVGKAVSEIKTENITDLRNNSSFCGYVKGVVDQIDTTELFSQFTAAFNSWFTDLQNKGNARYETFDELLTQYSSEFDTWFDNIKSKGDTRYTEFDALLTQYEKSFNEWFDSIKSQLAGDVATNLQNQIDDLKTSKVSNEDFQNTKEELAESIDDVKSARGQNLIPYPYSTRNNYTVNGITFTIDDADGSITINGTANANGNYMIAKNGKIKFTHGGNYTLSGCPKGGSELTYYLLLEGEVGETYKKNFTTEYGLGSTANISESDISAYTIRVCFAFKRGATFDNVKMHPMLEEGSVAHAYQPTILSNVTLNNTKAKKSTSGNYTLLASGWSGSSAPYSFTLSVAGVTASNNVELVVPSTITIEQVEGYQNAVIAAGTQVNGSITLKAYGEKPAIDLPITVIVRGD